MKSATELLDIYKKNVRLAESTIVRYIFYIKKFISFLAIQMDTDQHKIYFDKIYLLKDSTGKPLKHLPIDGELIDSYFQFLLANSKSYNVLNDNYKSLMSFFKFLEKNFALSNPLMTMEFRIKDFLSEKKFPKALTRGNIIKLLNSIITHSEDTITEVLLFTVLISTGCRISEILNLRCMDFDSKNNTFHLIKTKNRHPRLVYLKPDMGIEIQKYIKKRKKGASDYLFVKDNGSRFTTWDVNNLLKEYLLLAKLPDMTAHGTRHTFANLMADQGTSIDIIGQLLGQESIAATMIYIDPHYVRNKNFNMPEYEIIRQYLKNKIK
ncbi:tyrosine-type recombinase/integrase [Sporosarcina highlanderae]|uniref:Site-specific integrase n=1 Tax=Sporosarcina highlanderae TaxID=3035916 RepID=A0ABT8JS04_9BACL|nr:site-specific integrase [Sporosarcina highlanderae]MDN4607172.1 site-specific integrase [Sporosarcina highlanderae]